MRLKTTLIVLLLSAALSETAAARQVESAAIEVRVLDLQQSELKTVQSNGMSLSQAIESVRRSTGGKVVSAETRVQGGREVHYIKVLTKDGKVKTHKVNGRRR